jgi:3,4-dihydroxy 2-butanone 4-phosphate synthase/GTP cyclohydrolase II
MALPSTSQPSAVPAGPGVRLVATTVLPTDEGLFQVFAYDDPDAGTEHLALVMGQVAAADGTVAGGGAGTGGTARSGPLPPLVRVHSECLTGDALGSHRCDCGDQLRAARAAIAAEGRGVIVYLRGHEGRGIGLAGKLRAYALQDEGYDTVDANVALGFDPDLRSYRPAADVLAALGVHRVRLLSANPVKEAQLRLHGVEVVERILLPVPTRAANVRYLQTKRSRMGHEAPPPAVDVWSELAAGRVPTDPAPGVDATLVERYAPLVAAGPRLVIGQLGQSIDGFIAARTGDAFFVTGERDREHLHRLRALVDAVVVGIGTVVADDCQLTVRAVSGRSPVRVILDPRARAPRDAKVLTDGAARTLWCVGDDVADAVPDGVAQHVEIVPLPAPGGRFPPQRVLAALADRGLRRVLVEGGGVTVSAFVAADALDRLFVTTAPLLIGDGVPGLRFTGTDLLCDALRAPARRFDFGEDVCLELDLRSARAGRSGDAPTTA